MRGLASKLNLFGTMTNSLHSISKRVKQEGAVIVLVILRTNTWRAIVSSTMRQTGGMERSNLVSGGGFETPVAL
jgi:hypothetical protein